MFSISKERLWKDISRFIIIKVIYLNVAKIPAWQQKTPFSRNFLYQSIDRIPENLILFKTVA